MKQESASQLGRPLSFRTRIVTVLLCCLALSAEALGDGFVIDRLGRYVPEKEQLAFIEWQDGMERLYVATHADSTDQPSLWIVPVRASPEHVIADPVETTPQVVYYQSIAARAQQRLRQAGLLTVSLDTGFLPCTLFAAGGCPPAGLPSDEVREYQRVEKFGMVVVVLTARSPAALDRYLADNGVSTTASNLIGLEPYFGQGEDYTLVCGWLSQGGQQLAARAVRVDFPTPTIFYPLQPTRVYESEVRTVVYVRGMVKPGPNLSVPGVQSQYVRAKVKEINLGYSFAAPKEVAGGYQGLPPPDAELEALTRVEVTSPPSTWNSDLVLEPGAPAAVEVARVIDMIGMTGLWVLSIVLGMLLGSFLPWALVPRERRRWTDWLWAVMVGAATGLSVWVVGLVALAWLWWLREEKPARGLGTDVAERALFGVSGGGLAMILLAGALEWIWGRYDNLKPLILFFGAGGVLLFLGCTISFLIYSLARRAGWGRVGALALFTAAHGGVTCLIFYALHEWLSAHG